MRRNLLMLALLLACGRLRHTAQRIGKGNKMKLKETVDEYIRVFKKTEKEKEQAMLAAVNHNDMTKWYELEASLRFTQGCLYMLETIKEELSNEK